MEMDNDYFLHSLESSIHFSQPSGGGCLQTSVDLKKMNNDSYYKPRSSTTCEYIKVVCNREDMREEDKAVEEEGKKKNKKKRGTRPDTRHKMRLVRVFP